MRARVRAIILLLAALAALLALLPAASPAAPSATTPEATAPEAAQQGTTPAPAQAETTPSTSTSTPQPSASQTGESPPPSPSVPVRGTPTVRAQHPQGRTGSPRGGHPQAPSKGVSGGKQGAPSPTPRAGRPAPAPSALTPPLPLAFGSSLAGIPTFFIESFRIPPFLLPIFQAAGTAYGVPWQVLAAINEVETDYGRDLSVSSAGAEGWMQFLPSSWTTYGVDANGDGFRDPYNPADAIFSAARYLRAAGAATNIRAAVYAYNHSPAYVESVLLRARLLGGTPSELLGAITGLTEARFPVHAPSNFSDGFPTVSAPGSPPRTVPGTTIYSEPDAPVIAVQDGRIVQIGRSAALGHFISLRDAYGNTYTYARLGSVAALYPVLRPHERVAVQASSTATPNAGEPRPTGPASAGTQPSTPGAGAEAPPGVPAPSLGASTGLQAAPGLPAAPGSATAGSAPAQGGPAPSPPILAAPSPAEGSARSAAPRVFRSGPNDVYLHPLHAGVTVIAGTVLGHVASPAAGAGGEGATHMLFQIRPAGAGAPLIDPKPILDGWVQLENTSVFRAKGTNPFLAGGPTPGQVLLESKEQLEQQVLTNPGIDIYPCGRQDIEAGLIDRRVLATLEFLEVSGLKPTVSALDCGHSDLTAEGNVSEHSTGDAVDISAIDGIPIAGHQGPGSITDTTIRKLLALQGSMKPHQIISLMRYPGTDNTLALPDHYNHIHVGFRPPFGETARLAGAFSSAITPDEWIRLVARLGEIPEPTVRSGPSAASIPDHGAAAGGRRESRGDD
jgi:Transglycosylase SLT domain